MALPLVIALSFVGGVVCTFGIIAFFSISSNSEEVFQINYRKMMVQLRAVHSLIGRQLIYLPEPLPFNHYELSEWRKDMEMATPFIFTKEERERNIK